MWIYRRTLAKYVSSDMQQKISSVKYCLHDTVWVNHVRTGRIQILAGAEISHCCTLSKPFLEWTKPIQWVTECKINMAANCLQHKYRGHQEQCNLKAVRHHFCYSNTRHCCYEQFEFLGVLVCWFVMNWLLQGFQVFMAVAIDSMVLYLLHSVICWWVMVHQQFSFLFLVYNRPLPQLGSLWLWRWKQHVLPKHWCLPTLDNYSGRVFSIRSFHLERFSTFVLGSLC